MLLASSTSSGGSLGSPYDKNSYADRGKAENQYGPEISLLPLLL